jgi:eukaryotic-like serine/threonine-protein kinase
MAKKLKVGDVIRGYRITKVFGPGMMAISYAAQARNGDKVFFKQYKSPAPTVVWYDEFVAYQKELSRRVQSGKAAHFAVQQLDAFEERWGGPCYFQVYEFVAKGGDLQQLLDAEREHYRLTRSAPMRDAAVWARHVTWAKVLISAIAALHESKVVHADLKPANAYLIHDPTIGSGYQLKLIDMDFSLLADRRAPWHGHQGYVGTDNYRSPEHMVRGGVPGLASDVFTCGLMLYELLAGEHPYWSEDQAGYARKVKAHAVKPPALIGLMPAPASNAEVSAALHRCLAPDPAARPTAAELRASLSGRNTKPALAKALPAKSAASAPAAPAAAEPIVSDKMELVGPDGRSVQIGVRTELGKALVRQFGPESDFWDNQQCVLERHSGRQWMVAPLAGTTNETLVNGQALTAPRVLRHGDLIAVGRQAKGIVKMPLTARGR